MGYRFFILYFVHNRFYTQQFCVPGLFALVLHRYRFRKLAGKPSLLAAGLHGFIHSVQARSITVTLLG